MPFNNSLTPEFFNTIGKDMFPGLLEIQIISLNEGSLKAEMAIRKNLFAPNGYLHAGSVITLADTAAGYACIAHSPEDAKGFTTLESKSNFISSPKEGTLECEAVPVHLGRTTHVWDVIVESKESLKVIALFRCTQLIIYENAR